MIFLRFLLIFLPAIIFCQESIWEKALDKAKMAHARNLFLQGKYNEALKVYFSMYERNKNNALLNMRIGECYLEQGEYQSAREYLESAYRIDSNVSNELNLLYGKAHHYMGDIENALYFYNKYKKNLGALAKMENEVNVLIAQSYIAKIMMANPLPVKIKNLGDGVNSSYDDYRPVINPTGDTLYFTSRRPSPKSTELDPNDFKYFEDIHFSYMDKSSGTFVYGGLLPGFINTSEHDAILSISPKGELMFIYRNVLGQTEGGDIFIAEKKEEKWKSAKRLPSPINTPYFETSASITSDELTLFFVSDRMGGMGQGDIWISKKEGKVWGMPYNPGPPLNSQFDEIFVLYLPSINALIISSNSGYSMGGYDLFISRSHNDTLWEFPINLGYPINTPANEKAISFSQDLKKAYIAYNRPENIGGMDIYEIDLSDHDIKDYSIEKMNFGIVEGYVKAKDGKGISNALVSAFGFDETPYGFVSTDKNGKYTIIVPLNKDVIIKLEKKGYEPKGETVNLKNTRKLTLDMVFEE